MPAEATVLITLAGRLLLGALFVVGGMRHFFLVPALTASIGARGVPAPKLVLFAGTVFQIIAGLLFMSGFFVPWAACGLIFFTLAASVMLQNFWSMEGQARYRSTNVCLSNLAIIGGLLIAAVSPV